MSTEEEEMKLPEEHESNPNRVKQKMQEVEHLNHGNNLIPEMSSELLIPYTQQIKIKSKLLNNDDSMTNSYDIHTRDIQSTTLLDESPKAGKSHAAGAQTTSIEDTIDSEMKELLQKSNQATDTPSQLPSSAYNYQRKSNAKFMSLQSKNVELPIKMDIVYSSNRNQDVTNHLLLGESIELQERRASLLRKGYVNDTYTRHRFNPINKKHSCPNRNNSPPQKQNAVTGVNYPRAINAAQLATIGQQESKDRSLTQGKSFPQRKRKQVNLLAIQSVRKQSKPANHRKEISINNTNNISYHVVQQQQRQVVQLKSATSEETPPPTAEALVSSYNTILAQPQQKEEPSKENNISVNKIPSQTQRQVQPTFEKVKQQTPAFQSRRQTATPRNSSTIRARTSSFQHPKLNLEQISQLGFQQGSLQINEGTQVSKAVSILSQGTQYLQGGANQFTQRMSINRNAQAINKQDDKELLKISTGPGFDQTQAASLNPRDQAIAQVNQDLNSMFYQADHGIRIQEMQNIEQVDIVSDQGTANSYQEMLKMVDEKHQIVTVIKSHENHEGIAPAEVIMIAADDQDQEVSVNNSDTILELEAKRQSTQLNERVNEELQKQFTIDLDQNLQSRLESEPSRVIEDTMNIIVEMQEADQSTQALKLNYISRAGRNLQQITDLRSQGIDVFTNGIKNKTKTLQSNRKDAKDKNCDYVIDRKDNLPNKTMPLRGQRLSQISKEIPNFKESSKSFRKSIYTQDPNRQKNLFGNMKRIAQINDPSTGLTYIQKQLLPEDKTFMASQKGSLPVHFKPKGCNNLDPELLDLFSPPVFNQKGGYQKMMLSPTSVSPTGYQQKRNNKNPLFPPMNLNNQKARNRLTSHQKTTENSTIDYFSSQDILNNFVEELGSSTVTDSIGSVDLQHLIRSEQQQPNKVVSEQQKIQKASIQAEMPSIMHLNQLPKVASKVREWLQDSNHNQCNGLVLDLPAKVVNKRQVGRYQQRNYSKKNQVDWKQKYRTYQNQYLQEDVDGTNVRHRKGAIESKTHTFKQFSLQQSPQMLSNKQSMKGGRSNDVNFEQVNELGSQNSFRDKNDYRIIQINQQKHTHQVSIADTQSNLETEFNASPRRKNSNQEEMTPLPMNRQLSPRLPKKVNSIIQAAVNNKPLNITIAPKDDKRHVLQASTLDISIRRDQLGNVNPHNSKAYESKEATQSMFDISKKSSHQDQPPARKFYLPQTDLESPIRIFSKKLSPRGQSPSKLSSVGTKRMSSLRSPKKQQIQGTQQQQIEEPNQMIPNTFPFDEGINVEANELNELKKETDSLNTMRVNTRMQIQSGADSQDGEPTKVRPDSIDFNKQRPSNPQVSINHQTKKKTEDEVQRSTVLSFQKLSPQQDIEMGEKTHQIEEQLQPPSQLNLKEVSQINRIDWQESNTQHTTFLFYMLTLYSSQKLVWHRYDKDWALFELDHLKNRAPIPQSAQFLLIHLLVKMMKKSAYQQQKEQQQLALTQPNQEPPNSNNQWLFGSIQSMEGSSESPSKDNVNSHIKLQEVSVENQGQSQGENTKNSMTHQNNRKGSIDQVALPILQEAFKLARVRIQMCSGSLLYKFNDDEKTIFSELKEELSETYTKLKQSSSCINPAQEHPQKQHNYHLLF